MMRTYIGIDLGTSAIKLLLVDYKGNTINTATEEYDVIYPNGGWSEQHPEDWWKALTKGIKKLLDNFDITMVRGVSFGGQMHGLVILDENDQVIRPCILWNDGRTQKQTDYLNNVIGFEKLSEYTSNIAYAGFTAPKLLWIKEHEPDNFKKINKIMLPKDYLAYKLTGVFSTDYSDASGTLLLDVQNKCWSREMCDICEISTAVLPKLYDSFEVTGQILPEMAKLLGLNKHVKIITGAGDNAAAAIGTGTIGNGCCNISLGTSGTIFMPSNKFVVDEKNGLHSFCHADGNYHLMGCVLSAGSCNHWWVKRILQSEYSLEYENLTELQGQNEVFFMPYLMGERSPHNDTNARGAFIGMRPNTDRFAMTMSVLEGVAFALRDCYEVAKSQGLNIFRSSICGGGAKSKLWREILSNILGMPMDIMVGDEGPAFGAALLAMVGCQEYESIFEAVSACVKISCTITPKPSIVESYNKKYDVFKRLYPALKTVFN